MYEHAPLGLAVGTDQRWGFHRTGFTVMRLINLLTCIAS